jgi:acetyl esterase
VEQATRLLRTGMMTTAWIIVVPCLAILLGVLLPVVPWFRIYAATIAPNHTSWLFLCSIGSLLVGLLLNFQRRTKLTIGLVSTSVVAVLATAGIILHLLYVAESNGARINLVRALDLREFSAGVAPDDSQLYSRTPGEDLWLDIYHPYRANPGKLSPVIVSVHGGGFFQGSRSYGAANLRWYADHGWTVISIDYRLARDDRQTWNLAVRDVQCALGWTAAHADQLGVDVKRLTMSGGSAGGTLAMLAGYLANAGRAERECGPMPHVAAIAVKAPLIDPIASWYGNGELRNEQRSYLTRFIGGSPKDFPERYAAIDLRRFRFPTNPPTLIIGGALDPIIAPEAATDFMQKATASKLDVRQILFPYSGHDFNTTYDSVTNQAMRQIIAQFMVERGAGPEGSVSTLDE